MIVIGTGNFVAKRCGRKMQHHGAMLLSNSSSHSPPLRCFSDSHAIVKHVVLWLPLAPPAGFPNDFAFACGKLAGERGRQSMIMRSVMLQWSDAEIIIMRQVLKMDCKSPSSSATTSSSSNILVK